jgi:integrase
MPEKRIVVWIQRMADREHDTLQWHDPATGKRKSRSAGTCNPLEAELRRADLEYELNHGLHAETSAMTWEKFRELFEAEYLPHRRPRSRYQYRRALGWLERLAHPARLASVDERMLSRFAADLAGQKGRGGNATMATATVKVLVTLVHTALKWAHGQKLIPGVPRCPALKVPKKRPQPVVTEAVERLLTASDDPNLSGLLLCCWHAGLRLGEAAALSWEESQESPWVDLARDHIVLPARFAKGDQDQWVPLHPDLRQALLALPGREGRVFRLVSHRTGRPLGQNGISDRITRLARKAGVRLTAKSLRKGFGSYYAARVSAQVLQKLMRHQDIKTTMDYYANVDSAVEDAVRNRPRSAPDEKAEKPRDSLLS